jgi:surface protein
MKRRNNPILLISDDCMKNLSQIPQYNPIPEPEPEPEPEPFNPQSFIFTINTSNPGQSGNNEFQLPLEEPSNVIIPGNSFDSNINNSIYASGTYNFQINWGDNNIETINLSNAFPITHTYENSGNYTIAITGTCNGWRFNNTGDKLKITNILDWGNLRLGNLGGYFHGCENLTINATNFPDLSQTTNLSYCFADCKSLNSTNLTEWNVSNCTNTSFMFFNATNFNQPLNWNVQNVTTMQSMLSQATAFKQNIGSWSPLACRNFTDMFKSVNMNQPNTTTNYDSLLSSWSNKLVQLGTLATRISFSAGLSQYSNSVAENRGTLLNLKFWDIEDAGTTRFALNSNPSFIFTVELKETYIFEREVRPDTLFDYDLSSYTDPEVYELVEQDMRTFVLPLVQSGSSYNFTVNWGDGTPIQTITAWTSPNKTHVYSTTGIKTITITGTCVGWNFTNGLASANIFKFKDILNWGNLRLGNLGGYFQSCYFMNISAQDYPDLTGTTNLIRCFKDCWTLNSSNLSGWNVSQVTNMSEMFRSAESFNQPLYNWDVSKVTSMTFMFNNPKITYIESGGTFTEILSPSFNQNLAAWNPYQCTNFDNFLLNNNINEPGTTTNFDSLLISWAGKASKLRTGTVSSRIQFFRGFSNYSSIAAPSFNLLINTKLWIFGFNSNIVINPPDFN